MTTHDVTIKTDDGTAGASLHVPDGDGPWPAAIIYTDAAGVRDTFRTMGDRLAGLGFVTLVPDVYYRLGGFAPFNMATTLDDPDETARLFGLVSSIDDDEVARDARAFVDYLQGRPETNGGPVGTTGYCLGGRLSLVVAGRLGDAIGAAASFHGGDIGADAPNSPHRRADGITATVYVGGATDDPYFDDAQRQRLEDALTTAGVTHTIETYPAAHGFVVTDNPTYDADASARAWQELERLFVTAL